MTLSRDHAMHTRTRRNAPTRLQALILAACAAATPAASAAEGKRISPEKLRQCVSLDIEMDVRKPEMKRREQALEAVEAERKRADRNLQDRRQRLDRSDPEALADFNQQVAAYNALLDEAAQKRDAFNASVDHFNQAVHTFNAACEGVIHTSRDWMTEKFRQQRERGLIPAPVVP